MSQKIVNVNQSPNITYHTSVDGIVWNQILERPEPEQRLLKGFMIDATARDLGATPTTKLRPGLVMALHTDGFLREYGVNFLNVVNEVSAESPGDGSATLFTWVNDLLVPGSVTIQEDNAGGGTFTTQAIELYDRNYKFGRATAKTAPAVADVVRASYTHMASTADSTHIPVGILIDEIDLLQGGTVALDTPASVLVFGWPKDAIIKTSNSNALEFAKAMLMRLTGIQDLALTNLDLVLGYGSI